MRRASTINGCRTSPMSSLSRCRRTRARILERMGHHFGPPQPANHVDAILIGAPKLGGKPVDDERFYGVNDERRGSGAAVGY